MANRTNNINFRKVYQAIQKSGLFDAVYYLYHSPDVRKRDMDPLAHYIHYGWKEGRNPSEQFNTQYYLETYPDVGQSNLNPLYHYVLSGASEGRKPLPDFELKKTIDPVIALEQIKARLADHAQEMRTKEVIDDLLDYPDRTHCEILPCGNKGQNPRVSVCIPVFNGAKFLCDCINSILAQSFYNFELICVDDASTDESNVIIQSYNDPRIKSFENERNLGLIGNWNRCLDLSSGDYVCIFHQDDIMSPYNLEKKVGLLDRVKQVGLVYSDTLIIDQAWRIKSNHWFELLDPNVDFIKPGRSFFDTMMAGLNLICCPSVVARRECYERVGGFDTRLPFTGDMEMWMRLALFYDVAYISEPLLQYRIHKSNQTRQYQALDLVHLYLGKRILLEKFPQLLDNIYNQILLEDTEKRITERIIFEYDREQYETVVQYLYFFELIHNLPDVIDLLGKH